MLRWINYAKRITDYEENIRAERFILKTLQETFASAGAASGAVYMGDEAMPDPITTGLSIGDWR